jgi:hypothetical protein
MRSKTPRAGSMSLLNKYGAGEQNEK